jgi:hypothetical protein
MEPVTELTVVLSNEVAERLAERAMKEHTTPEQLASDAVKSYVGAAARPNGHRLSFIGIGRSGSRESIAEHHEEIIREHFTDKTAKDV